MYQSYCYHYLLTHMRFGDILFSVPQLLLVSRWLKDDVDMQKSLIRHDKL
jgi:hypothetical protein